MDQVSLQSVLENESEFSDAAFGVIPFYAPLHHLKREIDEVLKEDPEDEHMASLIEFADCLLLLLNAFRIRHPDLNANDLLRTCLNKIEINKKRKWNAPDSNMTFQHQEEDELSVFCNLCLSMSGPAHDSGCDRAGEVGCVWHNEKNSSPKI